MNLRGQLVMKAVNVRKNNDGDITNILTEASSPKANEENNLNNLPTF